MMNIFNILGMVTCISGVAIALFRHDIAGVSLFTVLAFVNYAFCDAQKRRVKYKK